MQTAAQRLLAEREFHDRQAFSRAETFQNYASLLRFDNVAYLQHETWIGPAMALLGNLEGLRVLDFGCGHAMASVVFARLGARVTAFDLSSGYLAEAFSRIRANDVSVQLLRANGERLPFLDSYFDCIWGNAILHHLDLEIAAPEIKRVLRPGGIAVFCEPWAGNRFLNWARNWLTYPGKDRTVSEQPLNQSHVALLRRVFGRVELRGFQFLSMARRIVRGPNLVRRLEWCDERLLDYLPALQNYCRYMVLSLGH
jgi:SAM-dependent methyltransferase